MKHIDIGGRGACHKGTERKPFEPGDELVPIGMKDEATCSECKTLFEAYLAETQGS